MVNPCGRRNSAKIDPNDRLRAQIQRGDGNGLLRRAVLLKNRPSDGAGWAARIHARTWRIVCADLVAVRAGLCGMGRCSVDRGRSRIMRKATPLQIAKCRRGHIRLPAQLKAQMFERVRHSRCAFRPKDGL